MKKTSFLQYRRFTFKASVVWIKENSFSYQWHLQIFLIDWKMKKNSNLHYRLIYLNKLIKKTRDNDCKRERKRERKTKGTEFVWFFIDTVLSCIIVVCLDRSFSRFCFIIYDTHTRRTGTDITTARWETSTEQKNKKTWVNVAPGIRKK